MHFPKFWAHATVDSIRCWHWSDKSLDEARALAAQSAQKIKSMLAAGGQKPAQQYWYSDKPLREPVVQELKSPNAEVLAVLTRNAYGCLVLNTDKILFVDVDVDEQPDSNASGIFAAFRRLVSGAKKPNADESPQTQLVKKVQTWCREHSGWGWRLYQTKAGFRIIATQAIFDALSPEVSKVFNYFEADPLYQKLCKNQKSFRARLSPKPWRCGEDNPPGRWPFLESSVEKDYAAWLEEYEASAQEYATCKFIGNFGQSSIPADIAAIIKVHDQYTRSDSTLPLA